MGTFYGLGINETAIQDLFADRCFRANGYTRAPALVQWMATRRCGLLCPHCLSAGSAPAGELDLDEVRSLLDQAAGLGVYEFLVTGGEPLARPDLPEVIRLMGERKIRWSLNTAVCPGPEAKKAMESWPPAFVAVSVDGPRSFHDTFRGRRGSFNRALEAVSFFNRITSGGVACGTTVTRKNLHLLDETLRIVMESGAAQWGLHLVFPEGNAESRPELMLNKKQLKHLIQFTADRRAHFPVTLGDELGYCGAWEPLLRDEPFFCAAGRAQCVILPDGHVVPCTTFDTSVSAGNIRKQPLSEIWENGFAQLRTGRLTGECEACDYSSACGGGCWLQRRHGIHCFREVWSKPGFMKKAAGIAVCLGLAACSGPAEPRGGPAPTVAPRPPVAAPAAAPARTPPKARAEGPRTVKVTVKGAPILINGVTWRPS
jgi:radical SAM protein with 4Fe4S-binding SPASM domain